MAYTNEAVGHVRGGRVDPIDEDWGHSRATIELDVSRFGPEALAGLDGFSHVEIIFLFDRVSPDRVEQGARHARGREDWPLIGIFAQRGKNRPNRLGVTMCRMLSVEGAAFTSRGWTRLRARP